MKKFKFSISFFVLILLCLLTHKFLLLLNYLLALSLHELAHLFVAIKRGYKLKYISLTMFGFAVQLQSPIEDKDNFAINIAGPMCNLTLSLVCLIFYAILPASHSVLSSFCVSNLVLAFFNLIPVYPLDGGKIFKSIFKTNKAYKTSDIIVRSLLATTFAVLFICSLFAQINWFYLLFAVFFALSKPSPTLNFNLLKPKTNKYQKIVLLKVDGCENLFSLIKNINNRCYTIFYCPQTACKYFDEDTIVAYALKFPLTTQIKDVVAARH